jgi:uncharacterized membrane protein
MAAATLSVGVLLAILEAAPEIRVPFRVDSHHSSKLGGKSQGGRRDRNQPYRESPQRDCITLDRTRVSPFSSALYSAEPGRGKACRFRLDGQNGLLIFLILMIDDLAVARVFHLLGIVHWIGGVAAVTTIVLPHARRIQERNAAIAVFESFERRFASQARISVAVTGLSGVYMLWRMMAWDRFELLSFWWLHLMVALWLLFALMLFIFEPLGMDRLFRSYALRAHDRAFALATWLHRAALVLATVAIAAGVLGAHGYL